VCAEYQPHITEKHKEFGPIVLDFDFVQDSKHDKRYYTPAMIQQLIIEYNEIIKKYVDVETKHMDAYVTEKNKPILRKGEYHDGVHIMYPYICTKPSLQMIMREEFIEKIQQKKLLEGIPLKNTIENVVDKTVIYKTGWLLYLSRKDTTYNAYEITHIYIPANGKLSDMLLPREKKNNEFIKHLVTIMSIRRFDEKNITPIKNNIDNDEIEIKLNKIKDKIITENNNNKNQVDKFMGDDIRFIKAASDEMLAEVKNLLILFSNERAKYYDTWYTIGRCLYNIDNRLLVDWIQFSRRCPRKFKEGECEELWKKMKQSNYTIATLHHFAIQDNPVKYHEMKRAKLNILLEDAIETSHYTIAKLTMEKYKHRYRCASIKHHMWYEFVGHRWIEIDNAHTLQNLISGELTNEYRNKQASLYDEAKEIDGEKKKKRVLDEATQISKLISKLHDHNFKKGIIGECENIAYDSGFLKNIDENIYLIGFLNGIYDLELDVFREGCPDDYVTLCTNYNYIPYDENDTIAIEINEFLSKIQPDKEMREYLMLLLSTCLSGSITEESFYVLTGSGANGKSKLMELLKYTLGDYFKPMDIRLLTEKRSSSSAASPEVADKKGIRACPFDEPRSNDEINTGFMKIFTGGDTITARALFKEPIYFKPQFKPFLLCNHLPNIHADDDGTWRRLRVIPFLSKFIKPADMTKAMKQGDWPKNTFPADNGLSEKLKEWNQTFMGMLVHYYRRYKKNGLVHPALVMEHTNEYRKKCDIFQDFMNDYLEKTNDENSYICLGKLHTNMRTWYKSNYDGKCPNKKDLRTYIRTRTDGYVEQKDSLIGYKIKTLDDEEKMDELDKHLKP
jgi:P4 family phage/plasmid primase-like protien